MLQTCIRAVVGSTTAADTKPSTGRYLRTEAADFGLGDTTSLRHSASALRPRLALQRSGWSGSLYRSSGCAGLGWTYALDEFVQFDERGAKP